MRFLRKPLVMSYLFKYSGIYYFSNRNFPQLFFHTMG